MGGIGDSHNMQMDGWMSRAARTALVVQAQRDLRKSTNRSMMISVSLDVTDFKP